MITSKSKHMEKVSMSRGTIIRLVLLSAFFCAVVYAVLTYFILGIFGYGFCDYYQGFSRNMEPAQFSQIKPQIDKAVSSGCNMLAQFTLQTFGIFCAVAGVLLAFSCWGLWHYFWDYLNKHTVDKGESLGL
jgi:hypothetical protein